jgi:F-type H+-transporting ATPase subunit a
MPEHSLVPNVLFEVGPVQVTETVVYSLLVSALLVAFALAARIGLTRRATRWQVAAEFVVEHFEGVMRDMLGGDPRPYIPLIATLALYIGTANLFGLVPAMRAPTADFSTTAALAFVVFLAVPFYGIRARGWKAYFKHYLQPTPLMLPLELISEFSRTLALAVRLFGNVISEELVIAVLLGLAGCSCRCR